MKQFSSVKTITSFSKQHKPAYFAELNEVVEIETLDCYAGQVKTAETLRADIDRSQLNPATGPVYINGIQAGDTLCVEVMAIETGDFGIMMAAPGLGPLGKSITDSTTKILPISDGRIQFNENLQLPVKAMIGVAGVAPEEDAISTAVPGTHGGNLDTKDIKAGNKLYLPVFVDGALAAFGDLHAAMGDGELSGTGVETSGVIRLGFTKVPIQLGNPMVEDREFLYFIASAESYEDAIQTALFQTAAQLASWLELPFDDSYRLMSAVCDLKFSQIVNKLVTVRVAVPKSLFADSLPWER
ncbi:acetamidase/formamidase family protein [Planococcus shenhongbingii]|uniref:Acetamidase/formamidase family protein n=1 Tax=Planococcus shenhongbingii TaxID=3058398 RepID=A0ABT8NEW8_9BACL|nr:acetamidase/formamidase family protein [Planococcus sp. N017]MDN7246407.1 acetamidase/formamidase family protein [Planococcus sp. N017]